MDLGKWTWIGRLGVVILAIAIAGCTEPDDEGNDGSADASEAADVADGQAQNDAADTADAQQELSVDDYQATREDLVFELWCKRLYECPEQTALLVRFVGEGAWPRERCPELISEGLFLGRGNAGSVEAGRMTYDEENARQCLDDVRAVLASDACPGTIDSDACDNVLAPTVGSGDTCARTAECEDDRYCNTAVNEDPCVGECTIPEPEGASCDLSVTGMCGDLTCSSQDLVEGTCVQPDSSGVGESCGNTAQCEDGLICNRSDGVCKEVVFAEAGDLCEGREVICPVETRCTFTSTDPPERRCEPVVELGESCGSGSSCQADAFCNQDDVCEERAAKGESCDPPTKVCLTLLECVEGECVDAFPSCYE